MSAGPRGVGRGDLPAIFRKKKFKEMYGALDAFVETTCSDFAQKRKIGNQMRYCADLFQAKSWNQQRYIDALEDPSRAIVVATGPAERPRLHVCTRRKLWEREFINGLSSRTSYQSTTTSRRS